MLVSIHILAGSTIGSFLDNEFLAFILGFLSHYFLDALPHWDYLEFFDIKNKSHWIKSAIDLLLGVVIVFLFIFFSFGPLIIISAALGAALPDILEIFYNNFHLKFLKPFSKFHNFVHFKKKISFFQGLPVLLILLMLTFLSIVLK